MNNWQFDFVSYVIGFLSPFIMVLLGTGALVVSNTIRDVKGNGSKTGEEVKAIAVEKTSSDRS